MSQKDKALFLYGFDVTSINRYINFKKSSGGPELTGILAIGNYTPTEFFKEVKRAMDTADGVNKYIVAIDRTINAGTTNRVTISTNGSYLKILFLTGSSALNSIKTLLGADAFDYTGSLTYTFSNPSGVVLYPDFATYDYLGPDNYVTNDGSKNISAAGIKETLVFAQMNFFQGQWKYITDFGVSTQLTQWQKFLKYATRQLKFEFTPSTAEDPTVVYQCTLESTPADGNGMGFKMVQMRGDGLFRFYDTGVLKFRVIPAT